MRGLRLSSALVTAFALGCGPATEAVVDAGGPLLSDAGDTVVELPTDGRTVSTPADSGTTTVDAGNAPIDAGNAPFDAGSAHPVGDNVIPNGSFEQWADPLPTGWFGLQTNLSEDGVAKDTTLPADGLNACRLANPSDTHKRFSTGPLSLRAGRYTCTYAVRGHGEIRTARYDTDFSSYSPVGFYAIDDDAWTTKTYTFSVAQDVLDTFELIFSVRSTTGDHLFLDDVVCARAPEPCDTITCDPWTRCDNRTSACVPLDGRCTNEPDCDEWQRCDTDHRCALRNDRCEVTLDCRGTPSTPVCDRATHNCKAGDPCAGVTCASPRTCAPSSGTCMLPAGACLTTADCTATLPACDRATGRCVGADSPANIFPNGGFEDWSVYRIPYEGEHLIPDHWYGLDIPGSTEIDPANVLPWTTDPHGGAKACQLIGPAVADRFTSDAFDVPTGAHTCAYWVRGHGTIRHRHYSTGGWSPLTPALDLDTDTWTPVFFKLGGNVRDFRLILYASNTLADRGHVLVDDVVCTRDP